MRKLNWKSLLAWALAAFFVVGGIGNIFVSAGIAEDYRRWGYPDWFHYVTGILELTTAALLAIGSTRLWGALLGSAVMLAAAGTVLLHGEYTHAIAPIIVLLATLAVGWIAWRTSRTS
ncbi:DoxX family protein [Novosphingobium sp. ST904]|uniref:DoxX family protein n=1 Tax=Novosphingobium sp. ST904 TaxID=1684385 RepID=UPI0006C8BF3F|nr:DoxX family protein [Novosphingobium sp. ST904]KPH62102.1 DoxX family protein [Novosphingobium sp. ST904]TCM33177.1 DoxX-like protein [Novosphingobium sp. ST904]